MARLLGSMTMVAVLLLAGGAFACGAEKSADASTQPVVTAEKQPVPPTDQAPATGHTTKAKTTETGAGG
jgi:hypothetical protein